MKCVQYESFGKPAEVLALAECALPAPGPGEVRVRGLMAAIHNHDLLTVRGVYGDKPPLPALAGSEGLGIVDAVGEGVSGFAPGQRVAASSVRGTWAEYFVAPASMLIAMPDEIPDELATQLLAMPLSALMLLEFMDVKPGQWVVQNAASGAVGKALAMLGRARGVKVLSLVRSDESAAELHALGIPDVLSTAAPDWKAQARALIGDGHVAAAAESVGGKAAADLVELLGERGTLVAFGNMSGEPMEIPAGALIYRQATVKGFWGSKTSREMRRENKLRLVGELIELARGGGLRLPVEAVFDLAEIRQAAKAALTPGRKGKVLLRTGTR